MIWNKDDIYRLDAKYANEGVPMHRRPLSAAMEILKHDFCLGVGGNPEVNRIIDTYTAMFPEINDSWPGAGIGLCASIDRVRKIVLGVKFGLNSKEAWEILGFASGDEWWEWCRKDYDIGSQTSFAAADIFDFTNGINAIEDRPEATTLWHMAQSNLEDIANILPTTFSVDSIIQPICLVAELAMKGTLTWNGVASKSFKGANGHNLKDLAKRMIEMLPHRDDVAMMTIIDRLPSYVQSRYISAGLTRLEVVRLAVGVQFIAASTLRRLLGSDIAAEMEEGGWPAPRRPFFP